MLDEVFRHLGLLVGHLNLAPVRHIRLRQHRDRRSEAPVLVLGVGQLVVELGLLDGTDPLSRGGVPEPGGNVTLDRLAEQSLLPDPGNQHGCRDLPLTKARDLDVRGQVGGRVLDGVVHIRTRHVNREPDLVVRQLLHQRRHQAIRPNGSQPAVGRSVGLCAEVGSQAGGAAKPRLLCCGIRERMPSSPGAWASALGLA